MPYYGGGVSLTNPNTWTQNQTFPSINLSNTTSTITGAGNAGFVQFQSSSGITGFGGKVGYANGSGGWVGWQVASDTSIGFSSTTNLSAANDAMFWRDGAGIIAQQNGVNAQTLRIYSTFTDASNYRRLIISGGGLLTEGAGTGSGGSNLSLNASGASTSILFATGGGGNRWQMDPLGNFLAFTDNAFDIGAAGANRPRNLYMGSWLRMASSTVATLPAAATAGAGARMFVTDASAPTFQATVVGGGAVFTPVYSDGTNWKVG